MSKEEALSDFLKGLRIVLNTASAYTKDHPYFIKAVNDFKEKIDTLFMTVSPIKINIAPDSLLIDGRAWQKQTLFIELANMFHLRKIKSIEFKPGLTVDELIDFLSSVALPTREFLRQGGFARILRGKENPHLSIEELDYSELLREEGEEVKDAWVHLFKEAVDKEDIRKISEFADNFEKIIKKFRLKDFSEDEELRENIYNFLRYLKATNKEKFCKCSRGLFNSLLKYKEALSEEKLDKIKSLFRDLDNDAYACIFWEGVLQDEGFDVLNLNLFSQLVSESRRKEFASTLLSRAPSKESLKDNPRAAKKVQELLSVSGDQAVSEVYRNILSSLFKDITFAKGVSFDRSLLNTGYHYNLLNLLAQERHKKRLNLILEGLDKAWEAIAKKKDFQYIKYLAATLRQIKSEEPSLAPLFAQLEKKLSGFLEGAVWEEEVSPELITLLEAQVGSSQGPDFYLNKIFTEGKINPLGLELFFKFFPGHLEAFYGLLEKKSSDMEFLSKIVAALGKADAPLVSEALKKIYSFANEVIRLDILRAMRGLSRIDEEFLYSILKGKDGSLKKEAMAVLAKDARTRRQAIELLSSIKSVWGERNKLILENLMIIEELELKDASFYLTTLASTPFFWNSKVREKALEILRRWH